MTAMSDERTETRVVIPNPYIDGTPAEHVVVRIGSEMFGIESGQTSDRGIWFWSSNGERLIRAIADVCDLDVTIQSKEHRPDDR